jgi:hypothetical protein
MREDSSAKLQLLIGEIARELQRISARDFARIEVDGISVVLSGAEIRAFRTPAIANSGLLQSMVGVRSLLAAALKTGDAEMRRTATIIGSDMLRELGGSLRSAEQARDLELVANLQRGQRHIQELLKELSRN